MTRLFQAEMAEREFGRAAVRVDALLQWATKAGIVFPPTRPDVRLFEVAHLESLLCAIERAAAADATPDELQVLALQIGHTHASTQRMIEEGDSNICRWLVGANTHLQWRKALEAAIASGELATFDVLTGFPSAPAESATATRPKWTPARLAELREFRSGNTAKATAERFAISQQRVRELLKTDALPSAPTAHNPFPKR